MIEGAGVDVDVAGAVGLDSAAGVAGVVVADGAVVEGQRPGGAAQVFSIETPPPSAVAELPVTTMLFRVRLAGPEVADAAAAAERAVAVATGGVEGPAVLDGEAVKVTRNFAAGCCRRSEGGVDVEDAGQVWPLTMTVPPLLLVMVRLVPPLLVQEMANSPAALSVSLGRAVGVRVIL